MSARRLSGAKATHHGPRARTLPAASRDRLPYETVRVLWANEGRAAAGPPPAAAAVPPFERTLALQGIRFRVSGTNQDAINTLEIRAEGLAIDSPPMVRKVNGRVTGAEVANLNADGAPEL